MTGKVWKLSDTVAATFFGVWLFSLFFRSFFGGLDIVVFIVAGIWGLSVWARAKHGEYVSPLLTEEQIRQMKALEEWGDELRNSPKNYHLPSNAFYRGED